MRYLALMAALLLVSIGCGPPMNYGDDNDDDDDNDTGDDDTFTGEQSEICELYLTCAADVTPNELDDLMEAYGPDGTCWHDPFSTETCDEECAVGLEVLHGMFPGSAACAVLDPYIGGYGRDPCFDDFLPAAYTPGEVVSDFALLDQHGDTVHLRDFCGRAVLIICDAMTNPGGYEFLTNEAQAYYDLYRDDFIVTLLLAENEEYQTPSQADLASYASQAGLTFPVLSDPNWQTCTDYAADAYIPSYSLLAPGLGLVILDEIVSLSDIEAHLP